MNEIFSKFSDNTIFIGIVGAAFTASLMYLCKSVPIYLWQFFVYQTTVRVFVKGEDEVYDWISKWLSHHPYTQRARNLRLTEGFDKENEGKWALTPGHGNHFLWINYWPIWIKRNFEPPKGGAPSTPSFSANKQFESYILTTIGRSQERLKRLIEQANQVQLKREFLIVKVWNGWWMSLSSKIKRPLNTVFLPQAMRDHIVNDAQWFFSSKEWFVQRGVPYRRGYLFHGLPGTGKTSLVTALASHFNRPIFYLNLNSIENDNSLLSAFLTADKDCILLLEDIDSVSLTKERKTVLKEASGGPPKEEQKGVTLSGLLNAIDGVASGEGRLLIMTTNHPETLDCALLRPGRVDEKWEFKALAETEALKMIRAFYPQDQNLASAIVGCQKNLTAAQWQQLLMRHRNNPRALINPLMELEKVA